MKKRYIYLIALFIFLIGSKLANAQFLENFESGEKKAYAAGSVDLSTGTWYLSDAILGTDAKDLRSGSKSVRLRDGFIRMDFNKTNGTDELTFLAGNSGFSGDGGAKIQAYYSIDDGATWVAVGDELVLTDALESYTIPVKIADDIRFRINRTAGGRLNIDNFSISDYIEAADEATIVVSIDGQDVASDSDFNFRPTLIGSSRSAGIILKNIGTPDLEISQVKAVGSAFSVTQPETATLAFGESASVTLSFNPGSEGIFQGQLKITSNAHNQSQFLVNLQGNGITDSGIITIAEARTLSLGDRVTVAGRVSVANQLAGPLYMQDGTGGLAVYYPALHENVEIGDSVVVSGPLTVFNPTALPDTDFLLQIAETDADKDISFDIIETENKKPVPVVVTSAGVNAGNFDSQLVQIDGVNFNKTGAFTQETDYVVSDGTGTFSVRIDKDTNIPNAQIPGEPVNLIGVVSKFAGNYQVIPRFTDDIGVEEKTYPGDDIGKDLTFDVAAWNVEWFGDGNGPADLELQFENVKTVIKTMDMDLYALAEISNEAQFNRLVNDLEDYGGFIAGFTTQIQKTAFLFKRAVIDSLSSGLVTDGMVRNNWADGRFPLEFHFNTTIDGETREMYAYAIHAKAMGDESSYNQRVNASQQVKAFFDSERSEDNVIMLGDYNDYVLSSTYTGFPSPYKNFVDDADYKVITKALEEIGAGTHSSGSMLDHITINRGLFDDYMTGSERVEVVSYIGSFKSTTSDHYPVWTRFKFGPSSSTGPEPVSGLPVTLSLEQNYPNPFNPSTVIGYTLNKNTKVKLQVFDVTGREVATLVNREETAGQKQITFDASALSSGVYFYRLTTSDGISLTNKMMLIK